MNKIKLELDSDMLKLISMLRIELDDNYEAVEILPEYSLGSHLMEDAAQILGLYDKKIKGTDDNECGASFPDDIENKISEIHEYISKNLKFIEILIHQCIGKGVALTPGIYEADSRDYIFTKTN